MTRITKTLATVMVSASLLVVSIPSQAATPAKTVEIMIGHEGGFVSPRTIKTSVPDTVVYNTGMALSNDRVGFRSDVTYLSQRTMSKTERLTWAKKLFSLTKTPKHGWGTPGVADVPNTTIRIAVGAYHRKVSIYALSFTNGSLTSEQIKARTNLSKALVAFAKALSVKHTSIYQSAKYEAWMNVAESGGVGLANPASVFCSSQGGTLSVVDAADGQVGYCELNGTKTEEWAYYRAHAADFIAWPASLATPKAECTVVSAKSVAAGLATAGETPQWLLPTGQVTSIYFRPVLPLERACHR